MKYDFESILDRHGMDALAVDELRTDGSGYLPEPTVPGFDPIPMWVADMNFPTAPCITDAIIARASHPAFGYFITSEAYYNAIISWQTRRNGVKGLEKKHIGYENGVLGCVVSAVNALSAPGESILVHSPTYIGFIHAVEDTGRKLCYSPLKQDENGVWRMDYEDMARQCREKKIHLAILCNPHNPCGRVWSREELEKAMEVFRENGVFVISDEIWSDLTLVGHSHIPTQSVSPDARERTVAIYAPSKTFNLAGLIGSYHIIYNDYLRDRVTSVGDRTHYNAINVLSMHALTAAYSPEGEEWLEELKAVLSGNVNWAVDFIRENFRGVSLFRPEGTYMLFLDCGEYCEKTERSIEEVLKAGWRYGVAWQDGRAFLGPRSIRMNLALPKKRVEEAFARLKEYVFV